LQNVHSEEYFHKLDYSLDLRHHLAESYARQWKDEYADRREAARHTRQGILANPNDFSALSVSPEERRRIYERRFARNQEHTLANPAFGGSSRVSNPAVTAKHPFKLLKCKSL